MVSSPDLSVKVGSLAFKNPIMPASGTFGYGAEFSDFFDPSILGAMVLKGVSVKRVEGNPAPRIYETPAGMINAIGLQNVGVETFIAEKLAALESLDVPLVANIWGTDQSEYIKIAERLDKEERISALELNISCSNIKKGGLQFGADASVAHDLTAAVRRGTTKQLWVKLSPSVTDIGIMAKAVEDAGADAVSLINSIPAMAVDVDRRRPQIANVIGGLSGPAIRPIAVRMVYQVANAVSVPVIGIGGIRSAEDVLEFLIVGASAVQIGTAAFVNPAVFEEILSDLKIYCVRNGIRKISDIIGSLELNR